MLLSHVLPSFCLALTVNGMRARFQSFCAICGFEIKKTQLIAKDFDVRRFVHAECVKQHHRQVTVVPAAEPAYPYYTAGSTRRLETVSHPHDPKPASAHPRHMIPTDTAVESPIFRFRKSAVAVPNARHRLHDISASPPPDVPRASMPVDTAPQNLNLHRLPSHNRPDSYIIEADKWIIFFRPGGSIPGVHEPFHHMAIEAYLFFRAQTCKDMWQILSKIKWMGMVYGHVLPNDKHQQPSLLYLRIKDTVRRINAWVKENRPVAPSRSLGLDNRFVSSVLGHLRCTNLRNMRRMSWPQIVYCVHMVMAHSACMRYGHFSAQDLRRSDIARAPLAHAWKLQSNWTKYTADDAVIVFFQDTPTAEPAIYWVDTPLQRQAAGLTASMLISWYLRIRDERFPDDPRLFPAMPDKGQRRLQFQAWLRATIAAAVPGFKLINKVRPHGLRAGWVCDRRSQKVPDSVTMREGRWSSRNAMGLYDRESFSAACSVDHIQFSHTVDDAKDDSTGDQPPSYATPQAGRRKRRY